MGRRRVETSDECDTPQLAIESCSFDNVSLSTKKYIVQNTNIPKLIDINNESSVASV